MNTWKLPTFRVGQGNYEELKNAAQPQEQGGNGKQDDGRGDAVLGGAPKPLPGDELYNTIHRAQSEATERASMARQQQEGGYVSGAEFAAAIALTAASQQHDAPQPAQDQAQPHDTVQQEAAKSQAPGQPQPAPEQAERGNPYSMRAEQAAVDAPQPVADQPERRDGLMQDFVTAETQATHEAERSQVQQQQRSRTMGLSM